MGRGAGASECVHLFCAREVTVAVCHADLAGREDGRGRVGVSVCEVRDQKSAPRDLCIR